MSDPRQQRRGEPLRPLTGADAEASSRQSFSQAQAQAPVPSVEKPSSDLSQRQPSSSTPQTPHSPAQIRVFGGPRPPRTPPARGEPPQKPAKIAIPRLKRT